MRNFLILVCFICGINNLYSQSILQVESYHSITKEYIKKCLREKPFDFECLHLKDTNNIALIIPIYLLQDSLVNSPHQDYSILSHFIDSIPSPYDQYAFIKQEKNVVGLEIFKNINDYLKEIGTISYFDDYAVRGYNPNLIKRRPFSLEKSIYFNQVQSYLQENPTTKIFFIYGLNGIWGYKDGKFIKILFKKKEYKEMDGDLYFKKYLYPQSPNGIRRIIEGESFIITIVGA